MATKFAVSIHRSQDAADRAAARIGCRAKIRKVRGKFIVDVRDRCIVRQRRR